MRTAKQKRDELSGMKMAMFAMAGGSVAFLFKLLEHSPIEGSLLVALYCFVIGLPPLIALALCAEVLAQSKEPDMPESTIMPFMALWVGPHATAIGVGAFIWHYNIGAAIAYGVAVFAAIACWGIFAARLPSLPHDSSNAP